MPKKKNNNKNPNKGNKNKNNKKNSVKVVIKQPRQRTMPAAMTTNFKRTFTIINSGGTTMRVRGKDLIYKIPDQLDNAPVSALTVIPANPAYWIGTRMAALASGYQNYRPLKFIVHYVPQCAVTQQGNVIGGTLWAMSPNTENLQQTLKTSNGGMLTQCYKNASALVRLGTNLQFNLFRMGGKFDQESNPFIYLALGIAVLDSNKNRINPGYFYLEYEYELKNPIGDTVKYYNSGLTQYQNYNTKYVNETLINVTDGTTNIGAIIQKDGNTTTWNDKPIVIEPADYVWFFCNQLVVLPPEPEPQPPTPEPRILTYTQEITGRNTFTLPGDKYVLLYVVNPFNSGCHLVYGHNIASGAGDANLMIYGKCDADYSTAYVLYYGDEDPYEEQIPGGFHLMFKEVMLALTTMVYTYDYERPIQLEPAV